MKVLFTGDRNYQFEYRRALKEVFQDLEEYPGEVEVIVGDCTGVDEMVRELCASRNIKYTEHMAHWSMLGKSAGMQRNIVMLDQKPDICIAVHKDYPSSKGTKHCASEAIKRGITTVLIPRNAPFNLRDYEELYRGRPSRV